MTRDTDDDQASRLARADATLLAKARDGLLKVEELLARRRRFNRRWRAGQR